MRSGVFPTRHCLLPIVEVTYLPVARARAPLQIGALQAVAHKRTNSLDGGRFRGVGVPVGDVERERVPLFLADAAEVVADLEGGSDNLGIPLFAGTVAEDRVELFVRDALAVRTVARHSVDRIGHCDNSG
jgi:hypothetical protein